LQRLGLHHVGVHRRAVAIGLMPARHAVRIGVHEQVHAEPPRHASRKAIISRNFQVVSTCSSGKGGARREGLARQVQHHPESLPIE
jgi:hypothetical protein